MPGADTPGPGQYDVATRPRTASAPGVSLKSRPKSSVGRERYRNALTFICVTLLQITEDGATNHGKEEDYAVGVVRITVEGRHPVFRVAVPSCKDHKLESNTVCL